MPPSPPPSDDKGKGKAPSRGDVADTPSSAPAPAPKSNPLTSMLASAARNAPSDIASLLASQGKPQGGSAGSSVGGASLARASASSAREQLVDDARGQAGGSGRVARQAEGGFRTFQGNDPSQTSQDPMRAFTAGGASVGLASSPLDASLTSLSLGDFSTSQESAGDAAAAAMVGSYSTSEHLDEPLHRVVRQNSLSYLERERAGLQGQFDEAWGASQAAAAAAAAGPMPQGGDFMALLDEEEKAEAVGASTTSVGRPSQAAFPSTVLPPGVTPEWTPPSPSNATISLEQLEMHRRLGALQDGLPEPGSTTGLSSRSSGPTAIPSDLRSAYQPTSSSGEILSLPADLAQNALGSRASEGVKPPDDDREKGEGVYAMDPVRALEGVLGDGGARTRGFGEAEQRGRESADRVRQRLGLGAGRGSYVDDVYGLPPLLSALLAEAEAPSAPEAQPDPDMEARREKAIRRLDALWRHLGGTGPGAGGGGADAAEAFLKGGGGGL